MTAPPTATDRRTTSSGRPTAATGSNKGDPPAKHPAANPAGNTGARNRDNGDKMQILHLYQRQKGNGGKTSGVNGSGGLRLRPQQQRGGPQDLQTKMQITPPLCSALQLLLKLMGKKR